MVWGCGSGRGGCHAYCRGGAVGLQRGRTDWPFIGGDWANSRYSTLDQIDTQSVANLAASTHATPVVKDGLMFIGAGTPLYALDAVWVLRPDQERMTQL